MPGKKIGIADFNPVNQFISQEAKVEREEATIPEGYKIDPNLIEKKTRRLQLLLQPSLYEKLKKRAFEEGKSVNDTLHNILEKALREEQL